MNRQPPRLTVVAAILLALLPAAVAPAQTRIFATTTSGLYWVAVVQPGPDAARSEYKTTLRVHKLPAGDWHESAALANQAVALAPLGNDLAVLFHDNSWKRLGSSFTTGPALPGEGPVLAWGGSPQTLLAVRAVAGGQKAISTQPATTPTTTTPTTTPATTPSTTPSTTQPTQPVLLRYEKGYWVPVADLPPNLAGADLTVTAVTYRPVLAATFKTGQIKTFTYTDNQWQDTGSLKSTPNCRATLVAAPNLLFLWTIDDTTQIKLFSRTETDPWKPIPNFELPKNLKPESQRTLTVAGEELRLLAVSDKSISEQRYDLTGQPRGDLVALATPVTSNVASINKIFQLTSLAGMVIIMLLIVRHRRKYSPPNPD